MRIRTATIARVRVAALSGLIMVALLLRTQAACATGTARAL